MLLVVNIFFICDPHAMFSGAGRLISSFSAFPDIFSQKGQKILLKRSQKGIIQLKGNIWQLCTFIFGWSTEMTVRMKAATFYRSLCMRQNSLKTGQMRHFKAFQKNKTIISIFVYFSDKQFLFIRQINLLCQHKNKKWKYMRL